MLKVTTRLVTIDVVAHDRHGNPIRDLTADDFQVFECSGRTLQSSLDLRLVRAFEDPAY